jgi:hypothetical protein
MANLSLPTALVSAVQEQRQNSDRRFPDETETGRLFGFQVD